EIREAQQRVAALALTEKLAGSANLVVALRDLESIGGLENDLKPLTGVTGQLAVEQDADALARAAPDAAAQLMQLRQSEALRTFDHHQRGVGHVDPDLDDRGANQELHPVVLEGLHDLALLRHR